MNTNLIKGGNAYNIQQEIRRGDDRTHSVEALTQEGGPVFLFRVSLHTAEVVRVILMREGYEERDGKAVAAEVTLPTPLVINDLPPKTGEDAKREPIRITGPNWEKR